MSTEMNMGPFRPVSIKGNGHVTGVPMFVDKLPLTIGGWTGEDIPFGRVVSIDPADGRRVFKLGTAAGRVVKGISMPNPSIMVADPGMNNRYFAGRAMTATTFGVLDIWEYDLSQKAPMEGSTVMFRNSDGMLAFTNASVAPAGYTILNASVYETLDPNGAKVFFNFPLVSSQTRETVTAVATPTATPAAGAVDSGTLVTLATTVPNADIYFTLDGSTPSQQSQKYGAPIAVTAAVTIKAIAIAEGYDPSAMLTAAYTLN